MQGDYNYEEERKKLKLGPFTTCIMIFKTTVGVGIFTFQYCYALCGMMWGSILSSAVFFCTIFGINQLLVLCNDIENDENGQTTVDIDTTT
jgi:amino acid permease